MIKIPKKLGLCISRIDKFLDENKANWVDIYDQLVIYNTEKANVLKPSTENEIEAKKVAKKALNDELPKLKEFMDENADEYEATAFMIQIMYEPDSGPWHGNIIVEGKKGNSKKYITLNHWHKGIGLIDISNHLHLWDGNFAIRCKGPVRAGMTLKDVIIYGLKWWASVDVIFTSKHYSSQLWPASCHGLADTVAAHIAEDYSLCPTQQEWWKMYKQKKSKKKVKPDDDPDRRTRSSMGFSRRKSRKKSRRKSRKKSRRKSRKRRSTRKKSRRKSRKRRSTMRKSRRKSRKKSRKRRSTRRR